MPVISNSETKTTQPSETERINKNQNQSETIEVISTDEQYLMNMDDIVLYRHLI